MALPAIFWAIVQQVPGRGEEISWRTKRPRQRRFSASSSCSVNPEITWISNVLGVDTQDLPVGRTAPGKNSRCFLPSEPYE